MLRYTDRFYIKVQQEIIYDLIKSPGQSPLVVQWSAQSLFVSLDRKVFYIIPTDKYFLRDSFVVDVDKIWQGATELDVYLEPFIRRELYTAYATGNMTRLSQVEDTYKMEFKSGETLYYINSDAIKLFPKQRKYAVTTEKTPIFVISDLNVLLGGIWPLGN